MDGEFLVCPTLFYIRAQLFVKVGGARPVPCGSRPTVWGTAPRFWCGVRLYERCKFGPGAKPWYGVWCPRSQLFVTMGAHAPMPYGVSDTVSDILMVNPAGVTNVSRYTRLTSRLDLSL